MKSGTAEGSGLEETPDPSALPSPITASRLASPRQRPTQSFRTADSGSGSGAADSRDIVGNIALETPQPYPFPTRREGVLGFPSLSSPRSL